MSDAYLIVKNQHQKSQFSRENPMKPPWLKYIPVIIYT